MLTSKHKERPGHFVGLSSIRTKWLKLKNRQVSMHSSRLRIDRGSGHLGGADTLYIPSLHHTSQWTDKHVWKHYYAVGNNTINTKLCNDCWFCLLYSRGHCLVTRLSSINIWTDRMQWYYIMFGERGFWKRGPDQYTCAIMVVAK